MNWYKPEYMGTIADWVGILVTALTIFLTVKYYLKADFIMNLAI